jgi:hypothetical protein
MLIVCGVVLVDFTGLRLCSVLQYSQGVSNMKYFVAVLLSVLSSVIWIGFTLGYRAIGAPALKLGQVWGLHRQLVAPTNKQLTINSRLCQFRRDESPMRVCSAIAAGRIDSVSAVLDPFKDERATLSKNPEVKNLGIVPNMFNFSKGVEADGAEFLLIEPGRVPENLCKRFVFGIPEKLYIRDCYRDLYREASNTMATSDNYMGVFTGIPGIGKSMFLIYFLYEYFRDTRFASKRIALELQPGVYDYFLSSPNGTQYYFFKVASNMERPIEFEDLLILTDLFKVETPVGAGRYHFIFSSPNPDRYEEFKKLYTKAVTYYLPPWEWEELVHIANVTSDLIQNYALCGGVPRLVFKEAKLCALEMKAAIDSKGNDIAKGFIRERSLMFRDSQISHKIVHVRPVFDEATGQYDYIVPYRCLASGAVTSMLLHIILQSESGLVERMYKHQGAALAIARLGAVDAGLLFESLIKGPCHFYGKSIQLVSLRPNHTALDSNPPASWTMKVPRTTQLLPNKFQDKVELRPNVYYIPVKADFSGIDSFCFTGNEKNGYNLTVFQLTVGTHHDVKQKGIDLVLSSMAQKAAAKINKIQLVFVVPAESSLFTTPIISNRKLKDDEEEDSGEGSDTEIKESGSEQAGNEEGSKDEKRRGPKRKETSKLPSVVDPESTSHLLKNIVQYKYEHPIVLKPTRRNQIKTN